MTAETDILNELDEHWSGLAGRAAAEIRRLREQVAAMQNVVDAAKKMRHSVLSIDERAINFDAALARLEQAK